MALNIETAIAWMQARKGQVSYSMDDRNGPDSYDCSSSVYYALRSAGASSAGWAVNTEYEHDWLIKNGYELIAENVECTAQRGDVFIWGRRGASAGEFGHTGGFIDSVNSIHCNPDAQSEEPKKGWQKDDKGYWYARANGSYPKDQFEYIEENRSWFYFDSRGYMYSEKWFKHTDGKWYWFDKDGYMATSWKKINGKWYYFNRDGAMQTGWVKYYDNWFFLDAANGDMKSDCFVRYNNGWYLLLPDGRMADKPEFTVEPDGLITTK